MQQTEKNDTNGDDTQSVEDCRKTKNGYSFYKIKNGFESKCVPTSSTSYIHIAMNGALAGKRENIAMLWISANM